MTQGAKAGRILGSLKDALNAASRDDTQRGGKAPAADAPNATRAETAVVKPAATQARAHAQGRRVTRRYRHERG